MLTALPLANPGESVEVVDDLMRTVVEWQPVTITTQDWSLLYATPNEPIELYDLRTDPKQMTNVAAKHPEVIAKLLEFYAEDLRCAGVAKRLRPASGGSTQSRILALCSCANLRAAAFPLPSDLGGERHDGQHHAKAITPHHRGGSCRPRLRRGDGNGGNADAEARRGADHRPGRKPDWARPAQDGGVLDRQHRRAHLYLPAQVGCRGGPCRA